MLRRHHRFFQSLQIIRDAALVAVAFYLAHVIRFAFPQVLPYQTISPHGDTLAVGMLLFALWPIVGWASGLYVSRRARGVMSELFDVTRVSVVAFVALVTITYFVRDVRFSRGTLILWLLLNVAFVSSARMVSRLVLRAVRAKGYNLRHVIVVGSGALAERVIRNMQRQGALGLRVAGVVSHDRDAKCVGRHVVGVPVLGTVSELASILSQHEVDQVIAALPIENLGALKKLMAVLSQETVDVRLVPDVYQYMTLCGSIEEFAGMPIINLQSSPLVGWNVVAKRLFDTTMASCALVLLSPLFALLGLLVKFSGPGPVFFVQERVGMDGRRFNMVKFRTMDVNAEAGGAKMARRADPRTTAVGGFLRRMSLDELPQLVNVLCGEMSLVGPRPERPCFIEDFKREIPRYALRHKIKAGMTGWAQVHGMRGNTSMRKRIELDLYYIENWSLLLDLKILIRTVFGGFLSPHAY